MNSLTFKINMKTFSPQLSFFKRGNQWAPSFSHRRVLTRQSKLGNESTSGEGDRQRDREKRRVME